MMRKASKTPNFPYTDPTTCYIISNPKEGGIVQISTKRESMIDLLDTMDIATTIELYAVWPGKTRSDCFVIDDIELLKNAWGI